MQPAGWTKKRKSSVGFLKKKKRMVAVCRNLPSCPNLSCFLELLVNKHHMAFTYCCYQVNISFRKQIVEFVFEFLCVSHINSTHLNSKVEFLFYFFLFNQLQPKPVQPKKKNLTAPCINSNDVDAGISLCHTIMFCLWGLPPPITPTECTNQHCSHWLKVLIDGWFSIWTVWQKTSTRPASVEQTEIWQASTTFM